MVSSVASRRHLRSAEARKLVVRRTRTVLGARDFAVSSAVVWNSLPAELQSFIADCCNVFKPLENSLVLVPELAHMRIFILRYTNVLIIKF